jgi:PhzF family phenazine biosynthesis protein
MAKKKARRASTTAARTKPARTKRPAGKPTPARAAKASSLPMYLVDAFTRRRFHGNAAGVVVLPKSWLPTETMQAIAAENNQAETAFVLRGSGGRHKIRWFTPTIEMDLCGHATLAAAHVLWDHEKEKAKKLVFSSASGNLPVERRGDLIVLDFPSRPGKPVPVTPAMCAALGRTPVEAYQDRDLMLVFENKREVHELEPDLWKIAQMDALGVIVTAPGAGHDFVSRFFAPRAGVPEDPVTGSAHCTLVPYWAARLKRSIVSGHQVSRRGGELFCELVGKRVHIGGHAVTYFAGTITV